MSRYSVPYLTALDTRITYSVFEKSASMAVRIAASRRWHALLPHRSVLAVEGADSHKLLQGLTTANVQQIGAGPLYTAFLDVKGRVLTDAFLVAVEDGVLIDVEAASLESLAKHIKRYKLRSKVSVTDRSDELSVMVNVDPEHNVDPERNEQKAGEALGALGDASAALGGAWSDPRLPALGQRAIVRRGANGLLSEQASLTPISPHSSHVIFRMYHTPIL